MCVCVCCGAPDNQSCMTHSKLRKNKKKIQCRNSGSNSVLNIFLIPRSHLFCFFPLLLMHSLVPQGTANISHCQRGLLECSSRAFSRLKIGPEPLVFVLVSNPESEVSSLLSLCVQRSERQCTEWPDELKMFFFLVVLVTHPSFLSLLLPLLLFYLVLFSYILSSSSTPCKCIYCVDVAVARQLKTVTGACQQLAWSPVH